jgi:phosphoglycerol geranylgeranyltransferase
LTVYEKLIQAKETKGAGYLVLIDPDKYGVQEAIDLAVKCADAEVDALLLGGSLLFSAAFDEIIQGIRAECDLPTIIFPGSTRQLSPYAHAILFLSLLSGRNPNFLIGDQVIGAPIIKVFGIEPISTGYLFIDSGNVTSAQFISDTRPIPRDKTDIAMAHALAAEFMGMKLVYLEAGSGAKFSVPIEMISAIFEYITIPMIVGGGIRKPEQAQERAEAGASFIVTGNVLEQNSDSKLIKEFAKAVHIGRKG